MKRTTWHDYAEWICSVIVAFAASFVGVALVQRFHLGEIGQTVFWPLYATLTYWLVIREIYFVRPEPLRIPMASVRVRFALDDPKFGSNSERLRLHRFTDKLDEVLAAARVGEYDGDEFGEGECTLFMYGPDPEAIYRAIEPVLRKSSFLLGAKVELFAPGSAIAIRTEVL
jgi:hypothetical protein